MPPTAARLMRSKFMNVARIPALAIGQLNPSSGAACQLHGRRFFFQVGNERFHGYPSHHAAGAGSHDIDGSSKNRRRLEAAFNGVSQNGKGTDGITGTIKNLCAACGGHVLS